MSSANMTGYCGRARKGALPFFGSTGTGNSRYKRPHVVGGVIDGESRQI